MPSPDHVGGVHNIVPQEVPGSPQVEEATGPPVVPAARGGKPTPGKATISRSGPHLAPTHIPRQAQAPKKKLELNRNGAACAPSRHGILSQLNRSGPAGAKQDVSPAKTITSPATKHATERRHRSAQAIKSTPVQRSAQAGKPHSTLS